MIAKRPKKERAIPREEVKAGKIEKEKPKGPPSQTTLRNKADRLAGAFCRSLGRCEAEGEFGMCCSNRLEWAHCKSRGIKYLRHDPLNCFCLCNVHHREFTKHPDLWKDFVEKVRPGTWQRLNDLLIEQKQKRLKPDYEYWIDYYERRKVA